MATTTRTSPRRFGRFELRPGERVLLADGAPVTLGARAFDVLAAFVDRPGALITKDELLATVWEGLVVEENNLQVQVSTLRKILGTDAVATIPGRGYRFTLTVTCEDDVATARVAIADTAEPPPAAESRTNLPPRLPLLYGRERDIDAIVALVRDHPVVTITGAGGIGKTRVAQAVARRLVNEYADGVWWVELAALADGALVPSTVAQAMGAQLPGDAATTTALGSLLATKRTLLVLDNCEHLADAVAELVDALTARAPDVGILVTSQETLRASEEHIYRLGGLATGDNAGAVALFEARAKAVDARFAITASNLPAVIEICQRLDGIPLAIELAAARLALLGVEGLRARLHERFSLLTGGARVVLRRHQTLRATLEWSHALLTADEQTVFRRLGVFAGGFTLEAAQQVASDERIDPWTALDHLGALVDKSLVIAEGDPVPRYRMLETTRAYALERLAESGDMQTTLRRHALAVLAILKPFEEFEWQWRASAGGEPLAACELDNLRAALEWADAANEGAIAIGLAGVSYSVWWSSSHLAEGLARCLALARYIDDSIPKLEAARFWITVTEIGVYSTRRESYQAALRAASMYAELGNDQRRYEALTFAAVLGTRFGTLEETRTQIDEAAKIERREWPARQRAKLQFARCFWFARQGRYEEALACAQRQVAICRDDGVEIGALYAMSNVTFMETLVGRPGDAVVHARASIARLVELGAEAGAGHLNSSEMIALSMLDRPAEALDAARNAFPRLSHEGDQHRLLLPLALINAQLGRQESAARILGFEQARIARTGEHAGVAASLVQERLATLLASLNAADRARLAAEGAAMREDEAFALALA